MDKQYIDDHHMVARYLADQLSEAEQEAFDEFLSGHPDMVDELGVGADFKLGLHALRSDGELEQVLHLRPWFRQPRLMAAAIAMLGILVLAISLDMLTRPARLFAASAEAMADEAGMPLPAGPTFQIFHARSSDDVITIDLPLAPSVVELQVMLDTLKLAPRYRMSLARISNTGAIAQDLGRLAGLQPDSDGFVSAFLRSSALESGRYRLTVGPNQLTRGRTADNVYVLNVTKPAVH
jgi:hypothetical protein